MNLACCSIEREARAFKIDAAPCLSRGVSKTGWMHQKDFSKQGNHVRGQVTVTPNPTEFSSKPGVSGIRLIGTLSSI
jgi:hypothetical protein